MQIRYKRKRAEIQQKYDRELTELQEKALPREGVPFFTLKKTEIFLRGKKNSNWNPSDFFHSRFRFFLYIHDQLEM